jgi:hypothetical protein
MHWPIRRSTGQHNEKQAMERHKLLYDIEALIKEVEGLLPQ